jgi:hypothetical protein
VTEQDRGKLKGPFSHSSRSIRDTPFETRGPDGCEKPSFQRTFDKVGSRYTGFIDAPRGGLVDEGPNMLISSGGRLGKGCRL